MGVKQPLLPWKRRQIGTGWSMQKSLVQLELSTQIVSRISVWYPSIANKYVWHKPTMATGLVNSPYLSLSHKKTTDFRKHNIAADNFGHILLKIFKLPINERTLFEYS